MPSGVATVGRGQRSNPKCAARAISAALATLMVVVTVTGFHQTGSSLWSWAVLSVPTRHITNAQRTGASSLAAPSRTAAQARGVAVRRRAAAAAAAEGPGVRVGVLHLPGLGEKFRDTFEQMNFTNETYFQTPVPDAFQMPLAAKLLAMSNTVDVVIVEHGALGDTKSSLLRSYQTVALTTNVPIVPCEPDSDISTVAATAVSMAELRLQAVKGGGSRRSIFFGLGANKTATAPAKKEKVYF